MSENRFRFFLFVRGEPLLKDDGLVLFFVAAAYIRVTRGYLAISGLASFFANFSASGFAFSSATYFSWKVA